eukprot:CAMPEP_0204030004 /NCGR_PEP_ID=MMETSP0360-20130528/58688_1 /ASSEMBLY_ACC=CAM_ASM_000342 /TAXON_ID=268821 /ORGANISM="Scrippsiella Hangoei, Strain SHTV-5" /LENGTH=59 /DNA_ID=CAMNT_0050974025 /DNA_START=40 /DNA_END=219 /DNA_ORIENTATION=+
MANDTVPKHIFAEKATSAKGRPNFQNKHTAKGTSRLQDSNDNMEVCYLIATQAVVQTPR